MRVLISSYGSRGDTEPMVALAVAMRERGAEVRVSVPPDREFADLLDRAGLPLTPAFMGVRQWIETARRSKWDLPRCATEMVAGQYAAITAAAEGCDAIVATGLFPSIATARAVSEKRAIPYFWTAFCPVMLPSPHHPPLAYPGHPHPPEPTDNLSLWERNAGVMTALFGEAVNAHRSAIGLATRDDIRDHVFTKNPFLASDPVLSPWRPTDLIAPVQTGAWMLPDQRPLPSGLEAFLEAGAPPVYVGFGSMLMKTAPDAARTAIAAVRAKGRRVVLARGWAELDAIDDGDDCLVVGEVNQQVLFRRVAAVVHHGGAGTTATAARAGAPQLIVPQVADQPFWGRRVTELGIGAVLDGAVPTADSLSVRLDTVLTDETRERANSIARNIRPEGATVAADALVAAITRGRT